MTLVPCSQARSSKDPYHVATDLYEGHRQAEGQQPSRMLREGNDVGHERRQTREHDLTLVTCTRTLETKPEFFTGIYHVLLTDQRVRRGLFPQ